MCKKLDSLEHDVGSDEHGVLEVVDAVGVPQG